MKSFSETEKYLHGPAMPLFNSGNWNRALHPRNSIGEFIYTDGGLHGRPASAVHGSPVPAIVIKKKNKTPVQAIPYPPGYRQLSNTYPRFIKTDVIPANSKTFTAPDGQTFLAPAGTDFQKVYDAGKTNGYAGMKANVWQYGIFDFQRNMGGGPNTLGENIFYSAYTNASNYAVGVYMNGAGANLWLTLSFASFAADAGSKNAGTPELREWQTLGWEAAENKNPNGKVIEKKNATK
jgi:hypothetical protein